MYKVVVELKNLGQFPTFTKAFKVMRKRMEDFLLPFHAKETCWIKNINKTKITDEYITLPEAFKIAYKIGLLQNRRKNGRNTN